MLSCSRKDCRQSGKDYPLGVQVTSSAPVERELNTEFLQNIVGRIDYAVLVSTAGQLGITLPPSLPDGWVDDEALVSTLHTALLGMDIIEGSLHCQGCSRTYFIRHGVANMLLTEYEVAADTGEAKLVPSIGSGASGTDTTTTTVTAGDGNVEMAE